MARAPRLVLDGEAVETLLSLSPMIRKRLLRTLEQLGATHPLKSQDFEERDDTGRRISVKAVRPV